MAYIEVGAIEEQVGGNVNCDTFIYRDNTKERVIGHLTTVLLSGEVNAAMSDPLNNTNVKKRRALEALITTQVKRTNLQSAMDAKDWIITLMNPTTAVPYGYTDPI
jgi:hypothetical protein